MSKVLDKMDALIADWEPEDRRALFVHAYRTMSESMYRSIDAGEFRDVIWVDGLLSRFADYYFSAVDAHSSSPSDCPPVWTIAFESAFDLEVHPLRVLFLGINAHINFDLALCVADVISDWSVLDGDGRDLRAQDYRVVDRVIARTIDEVQKYVVAPASPSMRWLDVALGPLDEWFFSRLITDWRADTWADAVSLLEQPDGAGEVRARIENEAISTAQRILSVGPN